MTPRILAVIGTRPPNVSRACDPKSWAEYDAILVSVTRFLDAIDEPVSIVSGGAIGVDSIAAEIARRRALPLTEHLPDYDTHGASAPLVRNRLIIADSSEVHAWPSSWSRGTHQAIRLARQAGKPVTVHAAASEVRS